MNNKIELARTLARTLHTPETWAHVERVAREVKAMDLVEDTPVTLDTIENLFGGTVREAVDGITRRTSETYAEYIRRTMTNPISHAVKRMDISDHLIHRSELPSVSLLSRYMRALDILEGEEQESA